MNELQQIEMIESTVETERSPRRPTGRWFGWWVAACLVLLAISSYQQLQIQRRLLSQSNQLKAAVAEAVAVSAATNQQLGGLRDLDLATTRVAAELQRVVKSNAAIRNELAAMEPSLESAADSVTALDQLLQQSGTELAGIVRKSADLQSALNESLQRGAVVAARLGEMARVQDEVTANLGEMVDKTTPLQRFAREE